jgi:hypothetical protein
VLGSYLGVACTLGVVLAVVGGHTAEAFGLAGGVLYGAADVAIKALTGVARHGAASVVSSPWLPAGVVLSLAAFLCFQRGLQAGNAMPVIALMTAGTTVVSVVGGLLVFGDPLGRRPAIVAVHLAAFALVAVGGWLLAPSQAAFEAPGEGHPAAG